VEVTLGATKTGELVKLVQRLLVKSVYSSQRETKEITVSNEQESYTKTCRLVNRPSLPFSIYVPEEMEVLSVEGFNRRITGIPAEIRDVQGLLIGVSVPSAGQKWEWDPRMDIVFFRKGITKQEAEKSFQKIVDTYPEAQQVENEHQLPPWALSMYALVDNPGEAVDANCKTGYAVLGSHEGSYFYIASRWSVEKSNEWIPFQAAIFDEWHWDGQCEARPKTAVITTFPEGMEQRETYNLVDNSSLPFTTYMGLVQKKPQKHKRFLHLLGIFLYSNPGLKRHLS